MKFPSKETVEQYRREYPVGCRVELVSMDDFQAPPIGTFKACEDTRIAEAAHIHSDKLVLSGAFGRSVQ